MACDRVRGGSQVPLREQVRVDVVVGDRAVLVRPRDAVDAEAALRVVVAERSPEARGLDEQLEPRLALELVVARRVLVADDGVCDVGPDAERRRPRVPVAGALLAADRPPREHAAAEPELRGPLPRQIERRVAPAERGAGSVRRGVREHRQDEPLGVPERVAVVAGAGEALGADRALLRARARLQRVEEREAHGLLQLGVAVELDVRGRPEVVEVRPLPLEQAHPPRVPRLRERRHDLARAARRASAGSTRRTRSAHDAQPLPRLDPMTAE